MRIMTVLGARPQFVKASVVSSALREAGAEEVMVHTGQHFDHNMSGVFFDELGIDPPEVNLHVSGSGHAEMTAAMLTGVAAEIERRSPSVVLVYGDTNSTLAAALAASKLNVPVAHVEAGLRSRNRMMPEEINRVVTDHVSDLLFTPTAAATANLVAENLADRRIVEVGDVMYDASMRFAERSGDRTTELLAALGVPPGGFVLATVHRAENTDVSERLDAIVDGLAQLSATIPVVMPLHPRTRDRIDPARLGSVTVIDPVGYLDMVVLESSAAVICTDSGGVQKEAYFHGVQCVTLRDETEWVELVELGWNRLVSPLDAPAVVAAVTDALAAGPGAEAQPYGDGRAAEKVAEELIAFG